MNIVGDPEMCGPLEGPERQKVLVAEDEPTSRIVLKTVLEQNGYEVIEAYDGIEALNMLQQPGAPKLVLLDWLMPGLDGIEVCRRVRAANHSDLPYVIMVTAKGETQDIVVGLDAGANDYIVKPYNVNELRARLNVGCRVVKLQAELHGTLENMEKLAFTDQLTMIANRRAIQGILEREMARSMRSGKSLCISMLDLDNFKIVNDECGHQIEDAVLKECAYRIKSVLRPYDTIGRIGGEEFLIIVVESSGCVMSIFERVRRVAVDTPFVAGTVSRTITASQGIATWNRIDSMDDLIRKADDALYRAKKDGRNRIMHFDDLEHGVDGLKHPK